MNDQPDQPLHVDTDTIRAAARQMYQITAKLEAIAGAAGRAAADRTQQHFPTVDNGPETGGEWDNFKDQVARAVGVLSRGAEYFGEGLERTADDYEETDESIRASIGRIGDNLPRAV